MKKILVGFSLLSLNLFAAISTNIQWDVRTTGNDSNGGGFVAGATGTDFSQQNAAQFSFADLASANASTTCSVTSASHNFVAADVGNIIHISAGTNWTTGWYSVNSVAANAATLDRACGSVASVSGGTWAEGGAFATIGQAVTVTNAAVDGSGGTIDGTVNVKNGTYTLTTVIAPSINYGIVFVGFNATHGDNGAAPTITTATNSTNLFNIVGASFYFDNFIFTNTAVTPAIGLNMTGGTILEVRNSSFSGFTNAIAFSGTVGAYLINVEVKNSTGVGISGSNNVNCINCYIHNNTGDGISTTNIEIIGSIVSNNAIGIHGGVGAGMTMCLNSSVANNTSDGIRATGNAIIAHNCIIYGNGGFGITGPGQSVGAIYPINLGQNNAYGSNTSGNFSNFTSAPGAFTATATSLNDVSLSAGPFTSATNFALNSTAGGGAAAAGAGFPGTFPGGLTTGTLNIGAVQTSSASGSGNGSGTVIYVK